MNQQNGHGETSHVRPMTRRKLLGASAGLAAGSLLTPSSRTQAAARVGAGRVAPMVRRAAATQTVEVWIWETESRWKQLQAAAGLEEQFPDVQFKWTALALEALHQKALTALAAGLPQGLPSIIRTSMTFYRALANTGALLDLTEQVAPYEQEILPSVWQGIPVDGRIYQVPDDTGVTLFGYRKDIFAQAGLPTEPAAVAELVATYDDLINVGRTLEQKAGTKLLNMPPDAYVFNQLILQDSSGYFDQDGNVIFDSDLHVQVAEIAKRLWDSNLVTTFEEGSPQMWQQHKDGKLATMFYPNWRDFQIIDGAPETKGQWLATKLPAAQPGGKRAHADDGVCLCIPANLPDDQKQLATEVALYLKLTERATVAHMETFSGAFVSYVPGLEAMRDKPSPVLDGQNVYPLYLDTAREEGILPWYRTSIFFPNADEAVSNAMFSILKENKPIQPTLKAAADSIRQLQESKGTK